MSRGRKTILWVVASPLLIIGALAGVTAFDGWTGSGRVARNVELAGSPVGRESRAQLTASVEELAQRLPTTPVEMDAGVFQLDTTAGELGLGVDVEGTVRDVMAIGRGDAIVVRPWRWIQSLFNTESADVVLTIDAEQLAGTLAAVEGDKRTQPVEPTIETSTDGVVVNPGVEGRAITVSDVLAALPPSLGALDEPIEIHVEQTVTDPRVDTAAVEQLAAQANEVTEGEVVLVAGDAESTVEGPEFRPAFQLAVDGATPRLTMDEAAVAEVFARHAPGAANPTGVRFEISGGNPVPVGGHEAEVCCAPEAPDVIMDALLSGEDRITLPTRTMSAEEGREWAAGLGVKEIIGSFTTNHACCESRVTNIQRMADILDGHLIPPGSTFSVNNAVGPRTTEKGFLEGGVIMDGEFTTGVGGGVSQYATTLFNAAFFAGLEIPTYKAHSKYISRYPFGREATLSYPGVDLRIRNNTPYGIVIWSNYTGTSITVQLWSTRTAEGAQTGQNKSSGCGSVTTERTRTFTDGRVETDTFRANYDCD